MEGSIYLLKSVIEAFWPRLAYTDRSRLLLPHHPSKKQQVWLPMSSSGVNSATTAKRFVPDLMVCQAAVDVLTYAAALGQMFHGKGNRREQALRTAAAQPRLLCACANILQLSCRLFGGEAESLPVLESPDDVAAIGGVALDLPWVGKSGNAFVPVDKAGYDSAVHALRRCLTPWALTFGCEAMWATEEPLTPGSVGVEGWKPGIIRRQAPSTKKRNAEGIACGTAHKRPKRSGIQERKWAASSSDSDCPIAKLSKYKAKKLAGKKTPVRGAATFNMAGHLHKSGAAVRHKPVSSLPIPICVAPPPTLSPTSSAGLRPSVSAGAYSVRSEVSVPTPAVLSRAPEEASACPNELVAPPSVLLPAAAGVRGCGGAIPASGSVGGNSVTTTVPVTCDNTHNALDTQHNTCDDGESVHSLDLLSASSWDTHTHTDTTHESHYTHTHSTPRYESDVESLDLLRDDDSLYCPISGASGGSTDLSSMGSEDDSPGMLDVSYTPDELSFLSGTPGLF